MQIAKWGNSLAVRLPAELVKRFGFKEGDQIELTGNGDVLSVVRAQRPEEVLTDLRRFRGRLPSSERLSRDEAHER